MIRTLHNNHRLWDKAVFALSICMVMSVWTGLAAADPSDLEELSKRATLKLPNKQLLKVVLIDVPIIIGPVPGFSPWDRFPRHWAPLAQSQRGPRQKEQPREEIKPLAR